MSRQRRKPRPAEPKYFSELAYFNGLCGICAESGEISEKSFFNIGERILRCPKTATTPTMRVHQHCYLKHTGSYAPYDPSRPIVRVGPPGQGFSAVRPIRRRSLHFQRLAREQRAL